MKQAYESYKKSRDAEKLRRIEDEELRRIDDIRQRYLHDYASDMDGAFEKGKLEGQVDAILIMLKANLKKQVPQRIVDALKIRTDSTALESLLVKAANCRSMEEFENDLK